MKKFRISKAVCVLTVVLFGNIFPAAPAQAVTRAPQAYVLPTGIQVTLERGVFVDLDGFGSGESDVSGTVRIFDSGNIGSYPIPLVLNDNTPDWGEVYGSREWSVASFGYGPSIKFTFIDEDAIGSDALGSAPISLNLDDNPNLYTNAELMGTTSIPEGTNDFFYRILADRLSVLLDDGEAWNTGVGTLAISDIEPSIYKLLTLNGGTLIAPDGVTIDTDGVVELNAGIIETSSISNPGGTFSMLGGSLTVGVFNGDLTQAGGTLTPGSSPGTTTVNGAYALNGGKLLIELGGLTPGSQHDQVIADTFNAGGILEVVLFDGFTPQPGDSFHIIDATTLEGAFANILLPSLEPGTASWDTGQLLTSGALIVVAACATSDLYPVDLAVGAEAVDKAILACGDTTPSGGTCQVPSRDGFTGTYDAACSDGSWSVTASPTAVECSATGYTGSTLTNTCACDTGYTGCGWNGAAWLNPIQAACPANASGSPACACDSGFSGALSWTGSSWAGSCSEIDACSSNPCDSLAVCTDSPPPAGIEGFSCSCPSGYAGDGLPGNCQQLPEEIFLDGFETK